MVMFQIKNGMVNLPLQEVDMPKSKYKKKKPMKPKTKPKRRRY